MPIRQAAEHGDHVTPDAGIRRPRRGGLLTRLGTSDPFVGVGPNDAVSHAEYRSFPRMEAIMRIWIVFGLLAVAAPVSAQHVVWSATMTAGLYESPDGSFVGYHPGVGVGSINNLDFEFRGKAYTIHTLTQTLSGDEAGAIDFRFNPGVVPHAGSGDDDPLGRR